LGRILPGLVASNAFSTLAQIFTASPVPKLRRQVLHTLYTFQRECKDSQPAVASLGLANNIIELIHGTRKVLELSIALPVLRLIAQALDLNGRQAVREGLTVMAVVALHSFVWDPASRVSAGRRVNATLGYLSLLVMYCEMPMSETEFDGVLEVIGFVVSHSTLNARRELGPFFEQIVFSVLQMINILSGSGLLTPACFSDLALGDFVNRELFNGTLEERALACDVWTHLLEHGHTGEGLEIGDVLDVIDQEMNRAGHRAMRLIIALLRCCDFREQLVFLLIGGEDPTNVGYRTFLMARRRDCESLRACAACLAELTRGTDHRELELLANADVVEGLIDCLGVGDEDLIVEVLEAMDRIFGFAREVGGAVLRNVLYVFFEKDGPDLMEELAQEWPNKNIAQYADQFQALVED
jgi:hypothetical protein